MFILHCLLLWPCIDRYHCLEFKTPGAPKDLTVLLVGVRPLCGVALPSCAGHCAVRLATAIVVVIVDRGDLRSAPCAPLRWRNVVSCRAVLKVRVALSLGATP